MQNNLIIYGSGKFAEYIRYAFEYDSDYRVKAFCLEASYLSNLADQTQNGLEILNFNSLKNTYDPSNFELFIAIGNDALRERIFNEAKSMGYKLASYVSSKATVFEEIKIGKNVFISEDTGIQPFVEIGDNTIIIGSKIGHHTHIGNHVLLSISTIGANSYIGDNSFLGLNSTIKPNTRIEKRNIIGMGCNITKNTKENEVYSSTPAKRRNISYGDLKDKYL
ncbi:acetyltransferase [Salegentibacter sediminis]|uniref:acetyltransferase n=1 Tax=Salegentibacter sediminis TaxID=1930251 RepID=UPI0009BE0434|nr:acetyltransferase [Salegentibacter sediminis]